MSDTIVVYHTVSKTIPCDDGFACACIVETYFENTGRDVEYVPATYQSQLPIEMFVGKDVLFLDFAYPRKYMELIKQAAKSLLVIDHHKTAAESIGNQPYAKIDVNHAACVLTWKHFFPEEEVPYGLKLIEDCDLYRFNIAESKAFISYLRSIPYDKSTWWELLTSKESISVASSFGIDILRSHTKRCLQIAGDTGQITLRANYCTPESNGAQSFTGNLVCANKFFASDVGDILANDGFAAIYTVLPNSNVEVSLRASKQSTFNVEAIASNYGGGGHRGAANFIMPLVEFAPYIIPKSSYDYQSAVFAKAYALIKNNLSTMRITKESIEQLLTSKDVDLHGFSITVQNGALGWEQLLGCSRLKALKYKFLSWILPKRVPYDSNLIPLFDVMYMRDTKAISQTFESSLKSVGDTEVIEFLSNKKATVDALIDSITKTYYVMRRPSQHVTVTVKYCDMRFAFSKIQEE